MNPLRQLHKAGQSVWVDFLRRISSPAEGSSAWCGKTW
jgi:hypothetical protein